MDCQVQSLYRNCHDVRNRQGSPVHGPRSGDARTNRFGGRRSGLGEGRRHDEPRRRHGDERRQQVPALPLLRRQGRAFARGRGAADAARARYAWAVARLARFARRLAPLAGRGPRAEQSGRLPFGRACLPVAAERQGRAKCRGAWARDVAKTDRGGTRQDEGPRRAVARRRPCRHRARCAGRRAGRSAAFERRKVQLALGSSVRDGSRLRGGARSKAALPTRANETD